MVYHRDYGRYASREGAGKLQSGYFGSSLVQAAVCAVAGVAALGALELELIKPPTEHQENLLIAAACATIAGALCGTGVAGLKRIARGEEDE